MTERGRIILAAGGTGGHMFPAQALAEILTMRGWQVALSTDARGMRFANRFPQEVERSVILSASPNQGGWRARMRAPFIILAGLCATLLDYRRTRPACVIGFGGYPSFPAIAAAWSLGIPRLLHEQNARLGRVNRLFATRVNVLACGTPIETLPKGTSSVLCGNPVRAEVLECAGAPYHAPDFGADPDGICHLLVIGGSQGASIMADIVPKAIALLPQTLRARLRVAQQARANDIETLTRTYKENAVSAELASFFTDIPARMVKAQLVISRAGGASIAEIGVIGRPAILIPFGAAANDHQNVNARPLQKAGGAIILKEKDVTSEKCAKAIASVLENPRGAEKMAKAALSEGRPKAAQKLAELVEATLEKQKNIWKQTNYT